MPNGQEAILLGCSDYRERLYKVYWNEGNLEWTKMTQTIRYPRSNGPIAIFIPDEINTCKLGKYVRGKRISTFAMFECVFTPKFMNQMLHLIHEFWCKNMKHEMYHELG